MGKFKDSLIGGSIDLGFGAVGSGLQTLFGIASSKYNADLQYQYNKKLADDAYQRQVDFWNLQNAYNTPAAQVSRLRQAGLNPALLNGGVQGNTAGNLSSVPTASVGAGGAMPSSPAANLGAMAETMSKLASAGMVNEQTKYWIEQAIGVGIENDVKELLRAKGWSEAAITEMDRAARWKAAYPDEDLPDNPFFDSWAQSDDGVNVYEDDSDLKYEQQRAHAADSSLKAAQKQLYDKEIGSFDEKLQMYRDEHQKRMEQFDAQNTKAWQESLLLSKQTIEQDLSNIERLMFGQQKAHGEANQYNVTATLAQLQSINTQISLYKAEVDYYLGKGNLDLESKKFLQQTQLAIAELEYKYDKLTADVATSMFDSLTEALPFGK